MCSEISLTCPIPPARDPSTYAPRRRSPVRQSREPQAVSLADLHGALRLKLDREALREVGVGQHGTGIRGVHRRHGFAQLIEEVLEAGLRDDLEDAACAVAGIPERVPLIARLVDEVPRLGVD